MEEASGATDLPPQTETVSCQTWRSQDSRSKGNEKERSCGSTYVGTCRRHSKTQCLLSLLWMYFMPMQSSKCKSCTNTCMIWIDLTDIYSENCVRTFPVSIQVKHAFPSCPTWVGVDFFWISRWMIADWRDDNFGRGKGGPLSSALCWWHPSMKQTGQILIVYGHGHGCIVQCGWAILKGAWLPSPYSFCQYFAAFHGRPMIE